MEDGFFIRLLKMYGTLTTDAERRGFLKAITAFQDFLTDDELKEINKWAKKMLVYFIKSSKPID